MAVKEGAAADDCRRYVVAECLNPDDRILLYTPFDHNAVSNDRVAMPIFPLVDSGQYNTCTVHKPTCNTASYKICLNTTAFCLVLCQIHFGAKVIGT